MKLIIVLAIFAAVLLFSGFIWMVCLGALAHIFNVPRLAIGFWPSVLVAFLVNLMIGGLRGSK